jgi:hypothetical protein
MKSGKTPLIDRPAVASGPLQASNSWLEPGRPDLGPPGSEQLLKAQKLIGLYTVVKSILLNSVSPTSDKTS